MQPTKAPAPPLGGVVDRSDTAAGPARPAPARPTTRERSLERAAAWLERRPSLVPLVAGVAYLPLAFLGYGTDIDVVNVLAAGESLVEDGTYRFSRPPGSIVYEGAVGVLDRIGGAVAVNVGSVLMGVLVLVMLGRLMRRMGSRYSALLTLFVAVNPYFVIAATSLGDFVWALALLLTGIDGYQRGRPVLAGVCWALALGCRGSTVLLVAAFLVAEVLGPVRQRGTRQLLTAGAVTVVAGVALFVPSWWSVGRDADFLSNELAWSGLVVHAGRGLVKNVVVLGLVGSVVVLAGLPKVVAAARRWRTESLVRFALIGAVASELLFLRFPWKVAHLLPVLVLGALVFAASPKLSARFAALLVASQLVYGVVGVRFLVPDVPDQARDFDLRVAVVEGPLLNDIHCRLDDLESEADRVTRSEQNWACTLVPWRGEGGLDSIERGG
jgi:hypothetical protein